MSFTFNIRQRSPLVISLYGDLVDRDECREMIRQVDEACEEGNAWIIFDMSDLRIMNSTGLNVLIHSLTVARKSGGEVLICGVSERIRKLFIVTKLNTIFRVLDTEEDALIAYGEAMAEKKNK
jgi:anti-sigma B factor antagonist